MLRYTTHRLAYLILVLLGTSLVVFVIMNLIPGDPAVVMLGPTGSPEEAQRLREAMGLDRSIIERFGRWLWHVLRGDLGNSFTQHQPVAKLIARRLPATLELTALAVSIGALVGLPLGVISALRRGRLSDAVVTIISLVGISLPSFWIGIMFILLFSLHLGWLPPSGYVPFTEAPWMNIKLVVLPSLTLGLALAASLTRFTRNSMLEVLQQDYMRTARSKGLSERVVIFRHGLKNAMLPILTVIGLQVGAVISGAVAVEQIFAWPGLGRLALQSVLFRDYTLMSGIVLVLAAIMAMSNLLVDMVYGLLNPRIRYE